MKRIAFFVRHFTERGTENAIFNYAVYNETILGNHSIIVCFKETTQQSLGWPATRISYPKFQHRFEIVEIDAFDNMPEIIDTYHLDFFYTLTHGEYETLYRFECPEIWTGKTTGKRCKTIKHCVFNTNAKQGDFYVSISHCLNVLYNTNVPVIPHIVAPDDGAQSLTLRSNLGIPEDAIVLGRHGGEETFDIPFVHRAIKNFLMDGPTNVYFLLMNTHVFVDHPRVLYLPPTTDSERKTMFIHSCDAMIHARQQGETFGLAVAEFSIRNKPVLTYAGSREREHLDILGERAILYWDEADLTHILSNIHDLVRSRDRDWNAYQKFSPESVMMMFDSMIFSAT
uniref:Glycosyl transferase family 1 domain-containing protein n=1 Tax=viral metagenome TaxID=1070528 RepID=A0A6C0ICC7_9ZZZZ